jgi:hypothetical protein
MLELRSLVLDTVDDGLQQTVHYMLTLVHASSRLRSLYEAAACSDGVCPRLA